MNEIVLNYVQSINKAQPFDEREIAIKYLDMGLEQMQRVYGQLGESYWKLKVALTL